MRYDSSTPTLETVRSSTVATAQWWTPEVEMSEGEASEANTSDDDTPRAETPKCTNGDGYQGDGLDGYMDRRSHFSETPGADGEDSEME